MYRHVERHIHTDRPADEHTYTDIDRKVTVIHTHTHPYTHTHIYTHTHKHTHTHTRFLNLLGTCLWSTYQFSRRPVGGYRSGNFTKWAVLNLLLFISYLYKIAQRLPINIFFLLGIRHYDAIAQCFFSTITRNGLRSHLRKIISRRP